MQERMAETIVDSWAAVWDRGEVERLDGLLAPDYVRQSTRSGSESGRDELKREILEVRAAFPDLRTTIESIVVDGERGAIFWRTDGTFREALRGVPPTGLAVRTHGSNALTLRDGLIVRERVSWDAGGLLTDSGVAALTSAFEPPVTEAPESTAPGVLDDRLVTGFNRSFVTGVTVITTRDADGRPRGLAVNSYASVSVEPPLVLVCVQKSSSSHPALFATGHLGVNVLSNRQLDVVRTFAGKGPDKFADLPWTAGPFGSPLIDGTAARLEAEIKERMQARTHTVFIARVRHAEVTDLDPMIYRAGRFFDGGALAELGSS